MDPCLTCPSKFSLRPSVSHDFWFWLFVLLSFLLGIRLLEYFKIYLLEQTFIKYKLCHLSPCSAFIGFMCNVFWAVAFLMTCNDSLWKRRGSWWAAIRGSSSDIHLILGGESLTGVDVPRLCVTTILIRREAEAEKADALLSREPDAGLKPRTLGSWPETKADAKPTKPSRCPWSKLFNEFWDKLL